MLTIETVRFERGAFALTCNAKFPPSLTAIIGPSGSGKSTLLSLIAGFDRPDAGRILWDGAEITSLAPGARPVATLFQDNNLFPHLDVLTNVALGASPKARPSKDALDRAAQVLEKVGLDGLGNRKPSDLSGGQQSRAALARILLTDRPVILMDEAFSALGPALKTEMLELTLSLMPDKTILMVTHEPDDAKRFAAHTVYVEGGHVVEPVATPTLFAAPPNGLADYLA